MDNWDNRILWAVARRLKNVATALDAKAARLVWEPFQHLLSWFGPVAEVPITAADFHRSRLGRTSRYYRRALIWARLLLQGSDLPAAGGQVPPLVLDAPVAFEKFAEVVARAAIPDVSWQSHFQQEFSFLTGQRNQQRKPDILLSGPDGFSTWEIPNTRMCWNGRRTHGWEPPKKSLRPASSRAIGTNYTSTCECMGLRAVFLSYHFGMPREPLASGLTISASPSHLARVLCVWRSLHQSSQTTQGCERRRGEKTTRMAFGNAKRCGKEP